MFPTYLQLGFEHITDLKGYDHMLFLLALCAAYQYFEWRKILVLVTAFTVGHSLTLALAVWNIIPVNGAWIELLIPITILATSVKNLLTERKRAVTATYLMALGFGLIHGMGFSNYLRSLLADEFVMPLFAFNVGIEFGQMLVVLLIFLIQFALIKALSVKHQKWTITVSVTTGLISLLLAAQRIPF